MPVLPLPEDHTMARVWRDTFGRDVVFEADAPLCGSILWEPATASFSPVVRTTRTAALDALFGWFSENVWEGAADNTLHVGQDRP